MNRWAGHVNYHVNYFLSKIAKNNGILFKIRFFIDKTIDLCYIIPLFIHFCLQITLQD